MDKEVEGIAISNGDSDNPILVSVVVSQSDPTVNAIVVCNADGSQV